MFFVIFDLVIFADAIIGGFQPRKYRLEKVHLYKKNFSSYENSMTF